MNNFLLTEKNKSRPNAFFPAHHCLLLLGFKPLLSLTIQTCNAALKTLPCVYSLQKYERFVESCFIFSKLLTL